ncbi:MAG: RluA family pseudouridine synthase [bacterium]|nr:RluA family pseudouridine synthase [bacterium]MBU1916593.1 RluA family pseudouridine synthase [bacterium]
MNDENKIRILKAIKQNFPYLSQKVIKKLLKEKLVMLGDKVAKEHDWVAEDVVIKIPDEYLDNVLKPNPDVDCQLIKKTDDYIFLDKGPRVHSVALNISQTDTVANWLLSIDPALSKVNHMLESGLLHRLDYETAGVMVAARTQDAWHHLNYEFKKNNVVKIYECLVTGMPPLPGTYCAYAGSANRSSQKIKVQASQDDLLTKMDTEVLGVEEVDNDVFLVTIKLITGFRHQIRGHLAFLGCPIIGDELYKGDPYEELMLHARELAFKDACGKQVKVQSRVPLC